MTARRMLGTAALALVALAACGKKSDGGNKPIPVGNDGNTMKPQPSGSTKVKIVSSLPRTGSANAQTTTIVNGIRLAIAERDARVGSFEIAYEDWDDASAKAGNWDPEVEATNAAKAVADPDLLFYIGTFNSGAAKISMPVLNRAGIIMISPGNTAPGLTKPGLGEPDEPDKYRPTGKITYFRVVPADDIQGRVGAEWMKQMGAKSVYVLDDRQVYGKGIADVLAISAEELGIKVLGREGIDPQAQEYKSLMAKIRALDPDFIYFGGTTQTNAGQLAKDLVGAGMKARFMVPDGCFEEAFITAAGAENLNGRAFITFGGFPPEKLTGKGADFVKKYQERYSAMPEAYAVYGYTATLVALDALDRAGSRDKEAIRKAVAETKQVDGPLGTWEFDQNGDTSLEIMSGNTVKDGKFEFVTVLGQK